MKARTPLTIITGALGSGKTTLLRHLLAQSQQKIVVLVNDRGETTIDPNSLDRDNIQLLELEGGCVCCSLIGEFEDAIIDSLATLHPDRILVEANSIAEPNPLIFSIQESLEAVRLDGLITIVDAEIAAKSDYLDLTTELQVEAADLILLNKLDRVDQKTLKKLDRELRTLNEVAPIIPTQYCQVDHHLLLGMSQEGKKKWLETGSQPGFQNVTYNAESIFDRDEFEELADELTDLNVHRARGFLRFAEDGFHQFNFVADRWDLDPADPAKTELIFIGQGLGERQVELFDRLEACKH